MLLLQHFFYQGVGKFFVWGISYLLKVRILQSLAVIAEGVDGRLYNMPTADNIAAIIPGHFDDEPTHYRCEGCCVNDIVLNPAHSTDQPFRISAKHRYTDPLHFVLLFCNGELGWRPNIRRLQNPVGVSRP